MPTDEVPTMNYVIEKVKAEYEGAKTALLGVDSDLMMCPESEEERESEENYDLTQVRAMYIDKVSQDKPVRAYTFNDTDEHTVIIIMNDSFTTKRMFINCSKVISLDISHLNTTGITDMSSMFSRCTNVEKLNLSGIDTSSVESMGYMFENCSNLASLNVSVLATNKAKSMVSMFSGCSSLTSLDLSNFITSNVEDMSSMFAYCTKLTSVDLSNFDTSNVTSLRNMFQYDSSLTSIDISNFDTSKVKYISSIFNGCTSLNTIKMGGSFSALEGEQYGPFGNIASEGIIYYPISDTSYSKISSLFPASGWTTADISTVDSNLSKKSSTAE
jgi:surface protein